MASGAPATPGVSVRAVNAANARSRSAAWRVIGPGMSCVGDNGTMPSSGSAPRVARSPYKPLKAAGICTEPAVSVPIASAT